MVTSYFSKRFTQMKINIKHGGLPPRSALKRTGRIVSKLSSKYLELGKFALYVFRKVVGLGVELG